VTRRLRVEHGWLHLTGNAMCFFPDVPRLRAELDPTNHQTQALRNGRDIGQILAVARAAGKDPALFLAAGTGREP
jgi:hypothetical protein